MASIFWDSQGVIMMDYLEQGRMINGAYYAGELRWLQQARLMMPNGDPQDRFSYPTITLIDSYIEICIYISDPTADIVPVPG